MIKKPLYAATVVSAKPREKAYKLSDGGGLYLEVLPSGSKSWRLKYRFGGVEKKMTFGLDPVITLQQARELSRDAKRLLAQGVDPQEAKKTAQSALRVVADKVTTFRDVAEIVFEQKELRCSESYYTNYRRSIEIHLMPIFGDRAIKDITSRDVLAACKDASKKGAYLSHKLAQRAGEIFDQAVHDNDRESNPVSKATYKNLPTFKEENFKTIVPEQLPEFFHDLREYRGFPLTKIMIEFLMHSMLRTIEVRRLEWNHINYESEPRKLRPEQTKNIDWTPPMSIDIPSGAELNRKNTPIVPMSKQLLKLLEKARDIVGKGNSELVFPMFRDYSRMSSENVITAALRGMGWSGELTGHGFRALARTTLEEVGKFGSDPLELQLGHGISRDSTEAAYRRVALMPERIEAMQWWSDFLTSKKAESLNL